MLELKAVEVKDIMSVAGVFKSNGYEVNTYVQWGDKVGGEVLYFTVEVPGITITTPGKPRTWLSKVLERIRQYVRNLRRNKND